MPAGEPAPASHAARTRWIERRTAAGALAVLGALLLALPAAAQEDPRIEQLQRQIEELQRQLDELRGEVENRMPPPPVAPPDAVQPVVSGADRIRLAISGQVNRALLFSEDGEQAKVFFVDNDNASSRIRLEAAGELTEDLAVGAVIEAELQSNSTREVSQDDESTGSASFDDRRVEVYVDSATLRSGLARPGPHGIRQHLRGRPVGHRGGRHLRHPRLCRRSQVRRRR